MPIRHPRIAVTNDPELAQALAQVQRYFPGRPVASIVHDLAVKGAAIVAEEEAAREAAIERLIAWSTCEDGLDWEALARVRATAW